MANAPPPEHLVSAAIEHGIALASGPGTLAEKQRELALRLRQSFAGTPAESRIPEVLAQGMAAMRSVQAVHPSSGQQVYSRVVECAGDEGATSFSILSLVRAAICAAEEFLLDAPGPAKREAVRCAVHDYVDREVADGSKPLNEDCGRVLKEITDANIDAMVAVYRCDGARAGVFQPPGGFTPVDVAHVTRGCLSLCFPGRARARRLHRS